MGWLLALALMGVLAMAGALAALRDAPEFRPVPRPGEVDLIATVDGVVVVRDDIRLLADRLKAADPGLADDAAVKRIIIGQLEEAALLAEALRRGAVSPISEAEAYRDEQKSLCLAGLGEADCRQMVASLGFDFEEFWIQAGPGYRAASTITRMRDELQSEWRQRMGYGLLTRQETRIVESRVRCALLENAAIRWRDEQMKGLYQEAWQEFANPETGLSEVPGGS